MLWNIMGEKDNICMYIINEICIKMLIGQDMNG